MSAQVPLDQAHLDHLLALPGRLDHASGRGELAAELVATLRKLPGVAACRVVFDGAAPPEAVDVHLDLRDRTRLLGAVQLDLDDPDLFSSYRGPVEFAVTFAAQRLELLERASNAEVEVFRSALDDLLVGVVVHASDSSIIFSNPQARSILGLNAAQLAGKTAIDPAWHFVREDGSVLPTSEYPVVAVLRTREQLVDKVAGIRKPDQDGITWVSVSAMPVLAADGEVDRVVVNFIDITDQREAERGLLETEQKFRALMEQSPIGVAYHRMVYDDQGRPVDYEFLDANQHYRELTGVDPRGQRVTEAFPGIEKDPFDWIGTFARAARDGERLRFQQHLAAVDRWYDVVGFQSSADHFVAAFLEITEQKRLEEQLRQAQKMEAIGQLAGGIAHDFNNLLQVIRGYGEVSLDDAEEGSDLHRTLGEIIKASERARVLVSQLLAFSRQQVLEMRDIDLNACITEMLEMLRRVIGEQVSLEFVPGHELGTVRADEAQIGQILTNLCVNARDAMPDGGRVEIETENVRFDDRYCASHEWASPGRYVLLSLSDNGHGMSPDVQQRIFDPFFTTKDRGKGTGLGLAMVYGLVRQHEGMIQVYSEQGRGTRFKIYLPLVERPATAVDRSVAGAVPRGTETVLIAEDDEAVRQMTREMLERGGYTVIAACDGEEAMVQFDRHVGQIDLVLLDVIMPGVSGRAVYDHVRRCRPSLPVIFASGYSLNAIHTNFILDDDLELLQKPFHRDVLLRKVREVLDRR